MNRQSMSTVPCSKSSNEVSDLLLLDSQVELVVLFVFLLKGDCSGIFKNYFFG